MFFPCFSRARAFTNTSNADSTPIRAIASTSCMCEPERLHQGGGASCPGRAFVLRDRLNILDVRGALRQDVVQVVAQTDEREALVKELAHARSSEQEQTQDHIVLLGRGAEFVG